MSSQLLSASQIERQDRNEAPNPVKNQSKERAEMRVRELCHDINGYKTDLHEPNHIEFFDPTQDLPAIFLEAPDKKRMLVQLVNGIGIKPSIAAYALLSTSFAGADAAILFLVERHDSDSDHAGKMCHPFVGYLSDDQASSVGADEFLLGLDPEVTSQPL